MKNLLKSFFAIALAFSLFSCNDKSDPKPDPKSATTPEEALFTSNQSAKMQAGGVDKQIEYRFNWQLIKTVTVKNNQVLMLKSPFNVGTYRGGDLTWKIDGDDYSALIPLDSKFINFGFFDKNRITKDYLNTLTFNSNTIWAGLTTSYTYDALRLIYSTQIACKTAEGKYYLLRVEKIKFHESITLEIYEGFDVAP